MKRIIVTVLASLIIGDIGMRVLGIKVQRAREATAFGAPAPTNLPTSRSQCAQLVEDREALTSARRQLERSKGSFCGARPEGLWVVAKALQQVDQCAQ